MTGPEPDPLRFVLLTGSDGIERWLAKAITGANELGLVECVAIARPEDPLHMPNRADTIGAVLRSPRHWAHFALRATALRTELTRLVPFAEALTGVPHRSVRLEQSGAVVRVTESSLDELRGLDLDFILLGEFGILKGDVLAISRHGVWSHHHGDPRRYRGRPSCFWELHDGATEVSAGIQRLNEKLDGGAFMALATVETLPSFAGTMARLYEASTGLLGTAAAHVRRHGSPPEPIELPDPLPPVHRRPTNAQVAKAVAGVVSRKARGRRPSEGAQAR